MWRTRVAAVDTLHADFRDHTGLQASCHRAALGDHAHSAVVERKPLQSLAEGEREAVREHPADEDPTDAPALITA